MFGMPRAMRRTAPAGGSHRLLLGSVLHGVRETEDGSGGNRAMNASDIFIEAIADRVAAKVREQLAGDGNGTGSRIEPRLLTVEPGAAYIGRSKKAMEHLIASKAVPIVRGDRRIFLDITDLDRWIL
jgi:hypothetical protein